ncbi:hypothetical protein NC661_00140 [Aquibacillus koreensis]|uniref:Uncharacterized protein n=1 Tax=Aquibacillus koreensis TaxID=279446 RepID=A0A9X4AG83_9BACI|nr:hypothetical protein [Aquibacillus koreensis]MCT2537346.1 hypothetical protein [Aquibacillus koreensis]MDC3418792.1 hypothetical protein [Aquibacillus koreensis]
MSLALKQSYRSNETISKHEFEKRYFDLMDQLRIIDQKLSTKTDAYVLNIAAKRQHTIVKLHHDIEELQNKVIKEKQEESHKGAQKKRVSLPSLKWFKNMQLSRK